MANDLAPEAALAAERARREGAEAHAARMESLAREAVNRPSAAPPPPRTDPGPDPLATFSKEAAGLTPEAATDLLDKGIQARINRTLEAVVPRLRSEVGQFVTAKGAEDVLMATLENNPDIAEDQEGFSGAIARVQYQLRAQGKDIAQVPPAEIMRLAKNKFREGKKPPPTPVDHVEGGSRGSEARPVKPEPPPESEVSPQAQQIADWYGLDPAEVLSFDKDGRGVLEKMSRDWPDQKNAALEEKGVFSKVPLIELPRRAGRRAKKAAAAAAGG